MPETQTHNRLPRNFHRTFKPERRYLNAMLRFAAAGSEGDYSAIAAATGIPTGESTGKAPAILDYCRAMGLLRLAGADRSAVKKPELTPFGRMVLLEDSYLKTSVSQWIAHLNMCSPVTGADVWYHVFRVGTQGMGMRFTREALAEYLNTVYGVEGRNLIGPLIGAYEDEAALKVCGVLAEDQQQIVRRPAPVTDELGLAYGAWILQLIADRFPGDRQVPITTLDAVAGWRTIPGWDVTSLQRVLSLTERKQLLRVDRHMDPWLLMPASSPEDAWKRIFSDLL